MILNEAIERYTSNAEYERIHGNLQGCLEFRQLAEWLKDYERLLEQEPCNTDTCKVAKAYMNEWDKPNNSDEISRQAVLALVVANHTELNGVNVVMYSPLCKDIKQLPPVNPQPKTGHWILQPSNKEQGERDFIWWKCSECGQVIYSETEKDRREYHAFCGRCGAKMIESKERSE